MSSLILRPAALETLAFAIGEARAFDRPADRLLSHVLRERRVGSQDRPIVAEGFYAFLRHRLTVEAVAAPTTASKRGITDPRALALAALGSHFRRRLTVPAGEVDRYEKFLNALASAGPHPRRDLPAWLWDRLGQSYGDRRTALAEALLAPAPLDLRVNTLKALKARRDTVLARLQAEGFPDARPTPYAEHGIRIPNVPGRRVDLSRHPLFEDGVIEVQDEGSQLLVDVVGARRGELVIDFCAGAGGKTLALAARMASTGRLYAFDTNERRLANLGPRLARSGATNIQTQVIADEHDPRLARFAGKADRVLVDAPCSGLGTLRRNPDLKWRQSPESIRELSALQASILDAAARLVRPGGRLVYATCSLLREENEAIVDAFLATHATTWSMSDEALLADRLPQSEHKPGVLQLAPDTHDCDGFFAAVLLRAA